MTIQNGSRYCQMSPAGAGAGQGRGRIPSRTTAWNNMNPHTHTVFRKALLKRLYIKFPTTTKALRKSMACPRSHGWAPGLWLSLLVSQFHADPTSHPASRIMYYQVGTCKSHSVQTKKSTSWFLTDPWRDFWKRKTCQTLFLSLTHSSLINDGEESDFQWAQLLYGIIRVQY